MQTVNDQQQKGGVELIQQIANLHDQLVESRDFAQALQGIRRLQGQTPGAFSSGALEELENDYRLMADFMLKGFKDPQRNALYGRLVRSMSSLLRNMEVEVERKCDPFFSSLVRLTANTKLDPTSIAQKLVKHVQEVAMLSLDEEQVRQQRSKELYEAHFYFIRNLFNAIVLSSQWNADMAHDMARLLSSPTIDAMDAQTLVSAITMATLNVPDPQKVIALTEVFSQADDETIRQRALVGWVFAIGNDGFALFPEVGKRVGDLLAKPEVRKEVLQLQKQVVFCQNAARDQETLRNDIMPNIMKNQDFEVSRFGIKEKEEDPMAEILHPDADDKKMEELEASFQKISDMQKRGADVYFGGFSHMKRFSFFYTLCNWFTPFYTEHPQLQHLTNTLLQSNFIKQLMLHGPFCDSDKYSFALGISSVYNSLPENIRNMMEQGELQAGMPEGETTQSKAYIRRKYLQDLYRFAMLHDSRKCFANPFDENHVFLSAPLFATTMANEARNMQLFLLKQKKFALLSALLQAYYDAQNADDLRMEGCVALHFKQYAKAEAACRQLLSMRPDDEQAIRSLAQACFHQGHFEEAAKRYRVLQALHPDNRHYALYLSIALLNCGKADEARQMLFKLNYEYPDDLNVKRALAWAELWMRNTQQAYGIYATLLASDKRVATDSINAAYCCWFEGRLDEAVRLMAGGMAADKASPRQSATIREQLAADRALLDRYEIDEVDRKIVADLVERHQGE